MSSTGGKQLRDNTLNLNVNVNFFNYLSKYIVFTETFIEVKKLRHREITQILPEGRRFDPEKIHSSKSFGGKVIRN